MYHPPQTTIFTILKGILILFGVFIIQNSHAQSPFTSFQKTLKTLENMQAGRYSIQVQLKSYGKKDTTHYAGAVYFKHSPGDTLGAQLRICYNKDFNPVKNQNSCDYTVLYNGRYRTFINHTDSTATITDLKEHGLSLITGSMFSPLLYYPLIKPSSFKQTLEEFREKNKQIKVDKQPEIRGYKITVDYESPMEGDFQLEGKTVSLWIDTTRWLPVRERTTAQMKNSRYYDQVTLENISKQLSVTDTGQFGPDAIPDYYNIRQYKQKAKEAPLSKGDAAPNWSLKSVDDKTYRMSELKDKVVILDFWFLACVPCMQLMPQLQELHQKYQSDQGVAVLTINKSDDKQALSEYKQKNNYTLPILTDDGSVTEKFKVSSYPTTYVIANGEIVHISHGYKPDLSETLEQVIHQYQ
jgi:thiol-disulfide isomerase/thioredoxin